MTRVVVVGGGIGGMVAALRARKLGAEVTLIEARSQLGGLASGFDVDGMMFDGGPYILLDRVRLGWALDQVDVDLSALEMVEMDPAYQLFVPDGRLLEIRSDLEATVASIEAVQPGAGDSYRSFVRQATIVLDQLAPLLVRPHHPLEAVKMRSWQAGLWAAMSLDQILRRYRVSGLAADAIRIWTYIAGGNPSRAPGPLALVPALIHRDGAARPVGGVRKVVELVEASLEDAAVEVLAQTPITAIEHDSTGVKGVTTEDGTFIAGDVVISDVGAAAALLDLVRAPLPFGLRQRMKGPLQSPGISAYLKVQGMTSSEVNFRLTSEPKEAIAFIAARDKYDPIAEFPGRIVAPISHAKASRLGPGGQRSLLDSLVDDDWWRGSITSAEVVATRTVSDWSEEFRLRDNAMNLIMARRQLLLGRLPHKIDHIPGLHLAGSWTHPGQWISFCSVSGVLAANSALVGASGR